MKQLTDHAVHNHLPLDSSYTRYQRAWEILGYIGFSGALAIFYIMVTKAPLINVSF